MKILSAALEFAPYRQAGALGEMVSQLACAMKAEGADVTLISPYYGGLATAGVRLARRLEDLAVPWGDGEEQLPVWEGKLPGNVRVFLLQHELFEREGIYGGPDGPYPDNPVRFGLFCKAVAVAAQSLSFRPDRVHVHDWPLGLVPYYLSKSAGPKPQVLMSIYDLAHQGHFPAEHAPALGIPAEDLVPDALEFFGHINFLKAGLRFSDGLVAPGLAHKRRIQTESGGHGMDGLLRHRADTLFSVPPGIDDGVYNPRNDPHLAQPFGVRTIGGKRVCKRALQDELGLPGRSDLPLVALAPPAYRILEGDALRQAYERILGLDVQLGLVASEGMDLAELEQLAEAHPDTFGFVEDEGDASYHRLLGGADLLIVPAQSELGSDAEYQALRYGTLPVVPGHDVLEKGREGEPLGFEYAGGDVPSLVAAVTEACELFGDQKSWRVRMLEGMFLDLSWRDCGRAYLSVMDKIGSTES